MSPGRARLAAFAAAVVFFAAAEAAWLAAIRPTYEAYLRVLQPGWSGTYKLPGALACYAILAALFLGLFAAPLGTARELRARDAALVGLAVYGVYHTTNLATLDRASWRVAALDTAWGIAAMTAVFCVARLVFRLLRRR